MVEQFLNKWKADITSYSNFDEVMDAMQLEPMARQVFKEKAGTLEYQLDGDTWTALAGVEGLGVRKYVYKLGEEIEGIGLDGVPLKTTSILDGEALIENSTSQKTGIPITITRRVKGDILECTLLVDKKGVQMTYNMTKM
ncbi:fatty acid-binding protein-like [Mizuhopecten yessoensis]|uniref:Fatty acid-binding protein n=1 Tax=Mizuhopecten yessoensis TaxID=6573 RepID=A0A210QH85_MIZYE|nr:fatty acid-binding protein-like [Mizuhopecten yessoensis]OWF48135.1 Fatty acid-binding protein [Mizuhopecten yessoensis]